MSKAFFAFRWSGWSPSRWIVSSVILLVLASYSVVQRNNRLMREDRAAMPAAE